MTLTRAFGDSVVEMDARSAKSWVEQFRLRHAHRLINPPFVIRRACRYCGEPMPDVSQVVAKANGDGYAHHACVQREHP